MAAGTIGTLATMAAMGDVLANQPVYAGLVCSLAAYVVVSLLTKPTPAPVMAVWNARVSGRPDPDGATRGDEAEVVGTINE